MQDVQQVGRCFQHPLPVPTVKLSPRARADDVKVVAASDVIRTCHEVQSSALSVSRGGGLLSLEESTALGHGRACGRSEPLQSQVSPGRRRRRRREMGSLSEEPGRASLGGRSR